MTPAGPEPLQISLASTPQIFVFADTSHLSPSCLASSSPPASPAGAWGPQGQPAQGSAAMQGQTTSLTPWLSPRCSVRAQGWLLRLCMCTSRSDACHCPHCSAHPRGKTAVVRGHTDRAPSGCCGPGSGGPLTPLADCRWPLQPCTCVGGGTLIASLHPPLLMT